MTGAVWPVGHGDGVCPMDALSAVAAAASYGQDPFGGAFLAEILAWPTDRSSVCFHVRTGQDWSGFSEQSAADE